MINSIVILLRLKGHTREIINALSWLLVINLFPIVQINSVSVVFLLSKSLFITNNFEILTVFILFKTFRNVP